MFDDVFMIWTYIIMYSYQDVWYLVYWEGNTNNSRGFVKDDRNYNN